MYKPMLAEDWIPAKVVFPILMQPKVDGVRGLNMTGTLTGRSRKKHANLHTTAEFSKLDYLGLDGEMYVSGNIKSARLCRDTTSALNSIKGTPAISWAVFDYITEKTVGLPYSHRYVLLQQRVEEIGDGRVHVMPSSLVHNMWQLEELDAKHVADGYEGSCFRDPLGMHKEGRSSPTQGGLLRIKRFIEEEAIVTGIIEGNSNENEAIINELGRTERSTHQENMVPNGMVGALSCIEVKTGMAITVSAGSMDHSDRVKFFQNPELILQKMIKFKHFPKGRKVLPRFPTYVAIKMESDI